VINEKTEDILEQGVKISYDMRNCLLKGELVKFANLIDLGWKLKSKSSDQISNSIINKIYAEAKKNGALGGKLLGAGGGGFLVFFVPQPNKFLVIKRLQSLGFKHIPFRLESKGLISWSYRENK
jgi:D-glycero-alpha-D-manno-heptose-7-phosphate kinase